VKPWKTKCRGDQSKCEATNKMKYSRFSALERKHTMINSISDNTHKPQHDRSTRFLAMALVAVGLLGSSTAHTAAQERDSSPRVVPPNAHYDGFAYAEWLAKLWQWILAVPTAENPSIFGNEANIGVGQPDHVWFVPLVFGNPPGPVERTFTIPAGKALFVPIFTGEADNSPCIGSPSTFTADELRALIAPPLDTASMEVEVDGVAVKDVAQYRLPTPVFSMTYPAHNISVELFGCTDALGTYTPAIADGYALILTPLAVGEHTIHEHIVIPAFNAVADNTFHFHVVPASQ